MTATGFKFLLSGPKAQVSVSPYHITVLSKSTSVILFTSSASTLSSAFRVVFNLYHQQDSELWSFLWRGLYASRYPSADNWGQRAHNRGEGDPFPLGLHHWQWGGAACCSLNGRPRSYFRGGYQGLSAGNKGATSNPSQPKQCGNWNPLVCILFPSFT